MNGKSEPKSKTKIQFCESLGIFSSLEKFRDAQLGTHERVLCSSTNCHVRKIVFLQNFHKFSVKNFHAILYVNICLFLSVLSWLFSKLIHENSLFIFQEIFETNPRFETRPRLLRARFQGRNFMINITHLSKSSTLISIIWLF